MSEEEKLCAKELAAALGVSTRYVYAMRSCGFPMAGLKRHNRTATVTAAVAWIKANDFHLAHGKGVTRQMTNDESQIRDTGCGMRDVGCGSVVSHRDIRQ